MANAKDPNAIRTKIWCEEAEPDNPFATRAAFCSGYDVYGDMLGKARWVDMLYLLFRQEAPDAAQAELLETLAVALANPGPRDASVHAAMCGGVGGSTAAACLIAALGVGAGRFAGGREIFSAVQAWSVCGTNLDAWAARLKRADQPECVTDAWPHAEHPPGFDLYGLGASTVVRQALERLAACSPGFALQWLLANRAALEAAAGYPLALSGVAAAAFVDLEFSPDQAEMMYLLLRLPGAAAHALEQKEYGYKHFPFFQVELESGLAKESK